MATVNTMADPLDVELETATPLPPNPTWVRNEATHASRGFFHVVSRDMAGVQMREWKFRCGWRFGGIHTVAADVEPPLVRHRAVVCRRCTYANRQS